MKVTETTLKNGIECVIVEYPETNLVSSNVLVKTGGRNEKREQYGLSHFVEHMAFKGTKSFPDYEVFTKALEDKGAVINAWTSEIATCYWNIIPEDHFDLAINTLFEQVTSLVLDEKEIEKERGPILEEIKRSHDDPYLFVLHNIYTVMWPEQAIGNGVLGPSENIKSFKRADFVDYINEHYSAENISICIVSSMKANEVVTKLEKQFAEVKKGSKSLPMPIKHNQTDVQVKVHNRDIKQGHIMYGFKGFDANDPRVPALNVLINILGKGLGSILFKEVREKRGLAYTLWADVDYFTDAGSVMIYAGVNAEKAEEAVETINNILDELRTELLPEDKVEKAKEFLKGITLYSLDGVQKIAAWYTSKLAVNKARMNPEKNLEEISKVTAEDIRKVANDIFKKENETLLVLGPFKDQEKFAKILQQ